MTMHPAFTLALVLGAAGISGCTGIAVTTMAAAKAGAESRAHESPGTTPLHRAAFEQDAGAVRRLLAAGARVDARNEKGDTPLAFAFMSASGRPVDPAVVDALLGAGADANAVESWQGRTLLVAAMDSGDATRMRLVDLLLSRGANVEAAPAPRRESPLLHAVRMSYSDVAGKLLAAGANVRARPYVYDALVVAPACERSAAAAALPKAIAVLRLLVDAGAEVSSSDLERARAYCRRDGVDRGANRLADFVAATYSGASSVPK